MGNSNSKYIRNLALSLMGQLGISLKSIELSLGAERDIYKWFNADMLWACHIDPIESALRCMKPETLGKIAACGLKHDWNYDDGTHPTSLHDVHYRSTFHFNGGPEGMWLNGCSSGKELLLKIACTAVVAEMTDIIKRQIADCKAA